MLMQKIGKFVGNIYVIPNNLEKYVVFFFGKHLKFIDSLQLMNDSLETLAKNITIFDMKYMSQEFHNVELMKRKRVYPDYMDSFDKFNDKNLPPKKKFFCMLSDKHITEKNYKHAQNVWNSFNLESMGRYHDFYLKSDVLL